MKTVIKKLIPYSLGQKLRGVWQITQSIFYYGYSYTCPFCNGKFRKLLPGGSSLAVIKEKNIIGAGRRDNCICPRCYSTDRDRLIYLYLVNFTRIFSQPKKMLHVAPSGGLKAILHNIPVLNYQEGIKYHEGFYYSKDISIIDIQNLDFDDNSFDIIFCNHVLEHIQEDRVAMKELYRVMKPNGWAILQVPISTALESTYEDPSITSEKEREIHFGQFDHVRIYGKDYTKRLESVGFEVEEILSSRDWDIDGLERYAINKEEILFVAHKK